MPSAVASTCAAQQDQNAFWTLHDFYFENQGEINVDNVVSKSRQALRSSGIDLQAWERCATDSGAQENQDAVALVQQQFNLGRESGVSGTPGFFVNGTFINGAQPLEAFEAAMEEAAN
jgi:protein-disulfide isomerase